MSQSSSVDQGEAAASFHLINEADAAKRLSLSRRTLQQFRLTGGGPAYVQLGARRIAYELPALEAWARARTYSSTSDRGAAR